MINLLFEVATGLVLTGTIVVGFTVLTAAELGRAICRDEEQREVAPANHHVRRAA